MKKNLIIILFSVLTLIFIVLLVWSIIQGSGDLALAAGVMALVCLVPIKQSSHGAEKN